MTEGPAAAGHAQRAGQRRRQCRRGYSAAQMSGSHTRLDTLVEQSVDPGVKSFHCRMMLAALIEPFDRQKRRTEKAFVLRKQLRRAAHEGLRELDRIMRWPRRRARLELGQHLLGDGQEEILFASDEVVDRRDSDPRATGELAQVERFEATAGEQRSRFDEQAGTPFAHVLLA